MKNFLICSLSILLIACSTHHPRMMYTSNSAYTDDASASDKQDILNSLQAAVKKQRNMDVTLKVHYLKVHHNWAYIETTGGGDPGINAVMKKVNGRWVLAHRVNPCTPVCANGSSSCADSELICKYTLHEQFAHTPVSIFPDPNAHITVLNS